MEQSPQLSNSDHNLVSLSDVDTSLVSSVATSSPVVSSLLFHSAVSNSLTKPLVPAYCSPASSQIPASQEMWLLSSNDDSLPNKLSELSFHMMSEEIDVAAITEVSPKNTLSVLSPNEIKINNYQLFSKLNSPLCQRGVCSYIRDELKVNLIQFNSQTTDGIESVWIKKTQSNNLNCIGCCLQKPQCSLCFGLYFANYDLVLLG